MTEDKDTLNTTDQKLIIFLILRKVPIVKTEKNGKGRTVFSFEKNGALSDALLQWASGSAILVDIRDVFSATEIFNMRVHNEYPG